MTVINFEELVKEATRPELSIEPLFLCVAAPRGFGKSSLCGTTGEPHLMLSFKSMEPHGKGAAKAFGGLVMNIYVDVGENGEILSPDDTLRNLNNTLKDPGITKNVKSLSIDSISALDFFVNQHSTVKSAKQYKDSEMIEILYREIFNNLFALHAQGLHIICTLATEGAVDPAGDQVTVTPVMRGYLSVNKVLGIFPDVAMVGKVMVIDDEGEAEPKYMIQFGGKFNKKGKKLSGEARNLTFGCRLNCVPDQFMPEDGCLPASLRKLIQFKTEAIKKAREAFNSKK